ncbi:MAG TPA: HEPN domain-containing protein [Melioribacteraceae bacterium]|nr:HEPN domain-containing protein [Melioribacteraceae bacterium]
MIEIHPKAIESFDAQANELLLLLKPYKFSDQQKPKDSSSRSAEYYQNLPEEKVLKHSISGFVDGFGNRLSRYFNYKGSSVGLDGDDYSQLIDFLENLYHKKEINNFLSRKFLEHCSFDWFECKYKGEVDSSVSFTKYLFEKAENVVKETKISIPISYLSIEASFKLGNLTYEFYDKKYFDDLLSKLNESKEDKITEKEYEGLRKDYQGVVFASKTITAEKERAVELIIDEVDKQIKLIRCFSPTTFLPTVDSYFNRMGHTLIPHNHSFIFDGKHPTINTFRDKSIDYYFPFTLKLLADYEKTGFIKIFDIINKSDLSDFEDHLLNSAFLFSHAIESKNFQDKLVYSLVSLETLLLKDTSEPIQNTIGLRLSFLTRNNITDRKAVIELIKRAYKLRSSYIHHGKKSDDLEVLQKLQHLVWQSIVNLTNSINKFDSQAAFLEYIEELILT